MRGQRQYESGQFVVILTLAIVGLLGCAALATDIGYFENSRRKMQNAADNAAIAGELEIIANRLGNIESAARAAAARNGFTDGAEGVSITINRPPASGPRAGDTTSIEVLITQSLPTFLLRVIGISVIRTSTRAVASEKANPICIYGLNSSASGTISFTGTGSFQSACAILADSASPDALITDDDAKVQASSIGVVGGSSAAQISPIPINGAVPVADPFAQRTAPIFSGCDHVNFQLPPAGREEITPGVYCGGIKAPAGSSASLILSPGVYIMRGGGIQLGGSTVLRNNVSGGDGNGGVMFYNTGDSTYPYKGINLTGTGVNSINAPTSGNFEGLLIFQDRRVAGAAAATNPSIVVGSVRAKYQGALYFPSTKLVYGGANLSAYTLIVADLIQFNLVSPTTIRNDYSSLTHGAPLKAPVLTE
jgi:hypothetical protein